MICSIKVCGVTRPDDALDAAELGAEYIGVIFEPSSPRFVDLRGAMEIADKLAGRAKIVGVFTRQDCGLILDIQKKLNLFAIQLHSKDAEACCGDLSGCGAQIWKTFWLQSNGDVDSAEKFPADKILVDSCFNGVLGGSGRISNWELASKLALRRAVILAGGITPENARAAVECVRPEILDVNSGVELRAGVKSKEKLRLLFENLR